MFKFDKDNNLLVIKKVDIEPRNKESLNMDLMKNQKDSYEKYRTDTIKSDLDFLCETMSKMVQDANITYELVPRKLYRASSHKETKMRGKAYYPIAVKLFKDGLKITDEIEVLRIPYMDDFCVLNVDGRMKVMLSEMKPMETLSFEENDEGLQLIASMERNQITLQHRKSGIGIKFNKKFIPIIQVLAAMLEEAGDKRQLIDIFANTTMRRTIKEYGYRSMKTVLEKAEKLTLTNLLKVSKAYQLGSLRTALNNTLNIDSAEGKILASPVGLPRDAKLLEAGTLITNGMIRQLKRNCINSVFVKECPAVEGMVLAEQVLITQIPRGTKLNTFLHDGIRMYKNFLYCPEDVEVTIPVLAGTLLSKDIIDAMYSCSVKRIKVRDKSDKEGDNVVEIPFFREICGNYTLRLKDIDIENMPEELSADMYHYYFGQREPWKIKEVINPNILTVHDLIAMVSLLTRASNDRNIAEYINRDADFLKRVNRINEIFSEAFRRAVATWGSSRSIKSKVRSVLASESKEYSELFADIYKNWKSELIFNKKLLATIEDTNPVSLLSQVNRVVTSTASKRSVSDSMRGLSLGYYGKICPYETPASKSIGLTNTLAVGCVVEDGIPKTPYYRIINAGRGRKKLLPVAEYYSVLDEHEGMRIGDITSLQFNADGTIKSTKVIARVTSNMSGEKMMIDSVDSLTLTHVNVIPEQHCSSTALLLPFAMADDGVRVAFALNLIRQALYVQQSEVPYVVTSMYKDLFKYSATYCAKASEDGVVLDVNNNSIEVLYEGSKVVSTHELLETRISNKAVTMMNYKVHPGQKVKKGDVLIDSAISREGYFSPGVNAFVAIMPYDGYNYEDSVSMSDHFSHKLISVGNTDMVREIPVAEDEVISIKSDSTYQYVRENGVVAQILRDKTDDDRKGRIDSIKTEKESGILYDCKIETLHGKTELTSSFIVFEHLREGDKVSGRHGNKGVDALDQKTSLMPMFLNGRVVDLVVNPCGIASRMNIGQELDGHAGFIAYLLGIRIQSDAVNGASTEDLDALMCFVHDIANRDSLDEVKSIWRNEMPADLFECAEKNYSEIKTWKGCFFPDGSAPLWNPKTGRMYTYPITFGVPYFVKVDQEVEHKIHARGGMLEEDYSMIYKQPKQGAAHGGGQKIGEMEMLTVKAHGAAEFLREAYNEKSDNVAMRINETLLASGYEPVYDVYEGGLYGPVVNDVFRYNMEVLNIKVNSDVLADISMDAINERKIYDPKMIIRTDNRKVNSHESAEVRDILKNELIYRALGKKG